MMGREAERVGGEDWRDRAACRGSWPELDWHPAPTDRAMIARLHRVCVDCPVLAECAEVAASEPYGFLAGRTEEERGHGTRGGYVMHRRRNQEACGPCRAANTEYQIAWRARQAAAS